jgi:serine protease Do
VVIERDACLHCGEMVSVEARICPHCGQSALVDLVVDLAVTDGRKRYRLARALSALGAGAPSLAEIQQALSRKGGVVLAGATRSCAARGFQILEPEGVASSLTASAHGRPPSLPWKAIGVALACLALGVLGVLGWRRPGAGRGPTKPSPSSTDTAVSPVGSARPVAMNTKEIAARALPSTVSLRCADSVGSGFFVSDELVLTNAHVLCAGNENLEVVRSNGQKQTGVAVQSDTLLDLAVVRVPGAAAVPLPIGDAGALVVGEQVVVIGSPMGFEFTVHGGAISNLSRTVFGLSYLQIEAKVNPGNSGGPVLNDRGQVVGVVSLKHAEAEGIGLALPINYAWSGAAPLMPAPGGTSDDAFAAMKAKADAENREVTDAVAEAETHPALLGGYMDQYGRLVARIGRLSRAGPASEEVTLKVMRGNEEICTLKGDVTEWKAQENRPGIEPRLRGWMEGNQLDRTAFIGEAPVRIDQCPQKLVRGLELELVGANPLVARVPVN